MPFAKKTAVFAISTTLLLSAVPSAWAADLPAASTNSVSSSKPAISPIAGKAGDGAEPAAAKEAKISKEQAIELAKTAVPLPEGYTLQGVNFNSGSSMGNKGSWSVQFEKHDKNRSLGNISATIDSDTGQLLNYNSYDYDADRVVSYPPKVDLQSAKGIAQALLHKMNPGDEANVIYNEEFEKQYKQPLNGSVRYQIRYDRAVNGIPFPTNSITFTIDGEGRFIGYSYQMDTNIQFEDTLGVLAPEEAFKQYRAENNPTLLYVLTHPNRNESASKPMLSYTMAYNMLDAKSGKLLDPSGKPYAAPAAIAPLTEKPLAGKPADNQNLNKDQAAAIVTAIFPLPAGATLQNSSYNENVGRTNGSSGSTWNFTWQAPGEKDKEALYIQAAVNAKTGEIVNYNKNKPYYYDPSASSASSPVTSESLAQAKEAAIAFVKKVLPHYTSELMVDTQSTPDLYLAQLKGMQSFSVSFKHLANGVPTDFESLSVGIDFATGEVQNFWSNLSNLEIPNEWGKKIEADQAEELLLSQYTLEKRYVLPQGQSGYDPYGKIMPYPTDSPANNGPAKVAYVAVPKNPSEYVFLDALSGEWRNRDTGEVTNPDKVIATDLENHWAQKELQLMIDYKAIDVQDAKVNPDQAIKRGEMIKMLITAMNGGYYTASYSADRKASFADVANGSQYFAYVESAVDANLIDRNATTFNPESAMTRDEMAELLVRALGYSKLAATPGLFNLTVNDAAAVQNKGQVAIIVSLGIMSAADGNFMPLTEVTRAQAATAFFRYLEKRAALQDAPIRNY